jgi:hypothetical protein
VFRYAQGPEMNYPIYTWTYFWFVIICSSAIWGLLAKEDIGVFTGYVLGIATPLAWALVKGMIEEDDSDLVT